ncbi:MAG: hypothetical protein QOC62_2457, partial [Mycobacterium sp.]|nr:hypothetical protein [Mycobacterium sp.]
LRTRVPLGPFDMSTSDQLDANYARPKARPKVRPKGFEPPTF